MSKAWGTWLGAAMLALLVSTGCTLEFDASLLNNNNNVSLTCGDGVVDTGETCDDRNNLPGDGCVSCVQQPGWYCNGEPSTCETNCGDSIVAGTEECDGALTLTCSEHNPNLTGGNVTCTTSCRFNTSACSGCGNGQIESPEQCDGNSPAGLNNQACTDFGFFAGTLTCDATCTFNTSGCHNCGNGQIETASGESCDDGNSGAGDGCSDQCTEEAGWSCTGTPSNCSPICGDGLRVGSEACDDGDQDDGDGCDRLCTVEAGWTCQGTPSQCIATRCGDGIHVGTEECDDNGTSTGDGCDNNCMVEDGWTCDQSDPSNCDPICGDGLMRGAEACDDGNLADGDGCSSTCTKEAGFDCTIADPSYCWCTTAACDSLSSLLNNCGCGPSQSCGLSGVSGDEISCVALGTIPFYGACGGGGLCVAGSDCFGNPTDGFFCKPFCDSTAPGAGDCPSCGACIGYFTTNGGDIGLCTAQDSCDPTLNTGCSAGEACYPFGCGTFCFSEGSAAPGATCGGLVDACTAGYSCDGAGNCIKNCRLSQGNADCPGGTAANAPCVDFGSSIPDLGRCSP